MGHAATRKLIFRLGETGFLLDLERVVEICEQLTTQFNPAQSDLREGIVGSLAFRQTQVPVVDPALYFGTHGERSIAEKSALILNGVEGNWALLVDRVEEIISADRLQACVIPPLLQHRVENYYSQISLLAGEPLIHFEAAPFCGRSTAA